MSALDWIGLVIGGLVVWTAVAVPCALLAGRVIALRDAEEPEHAVR